VRDDIGLFEEKGIKPFGVNPASVEKHLDYVNKKGFPFPLLSDPGRAIASKYGAVKLMGKSINRSVFVIGKDGKIIFAQEGLPADEEILASV
jgi:peroxiredoxin Q/BCP